MDKKINICIASDDNYSKFCGVLIASILYSAELETKLSFFILDGGISKQNKEKILSLKLIKNCEINFLEVDNALFCDFDKIQTHSYITTPAYYRLKLGSLLKDIERVIYFDCDVIVNCDLKELYFSNIENYALAGIRDINKRMLRKNPNYINSGVLLINLKEYRKENIEKQLFDYVKENFCNIKMGDQEIINKVLKGKIKLLDDEYNVQISNFTNRSNYTNNPKIIHFTSRRKPWHFGSFSYHKKYYFKYLQMTPWRLNPEEMKYWQFKNEVVSIFGYLKYRPFFLLRPRFYMAFYCTYIKPLLKGDEVA